MAQAIEPIAKRADHVMLYRQEQFCPYRLAGQFCAGTKKPIYLIGLTV
jgi:hypothetical protein